MKKEKKKGGKGKGGRQWLGSIKRKRNANRPGRRERCEASQQKTRVGAGVMVRGLGERRVDCIASTRSARAALARVRDRGQERQRDERV